jgi:hypothetical protein
MLIKVYPVRYIPVDCDHLFLMLANSQFELSWSLSFHFWLVPCHCYCHRDFFATKFSRKFSKCRLFVDHYEWTSLNPMPNAQVCDLYLRVHITKLQLQTTFPKPLYIPHSACIHQTLLAAENLDVCTACDPWDSNIQLTMVRDRRWQIYPNIVVQWLTLTLVDCHAQSL